KSGNHIQNTSPLKTCLAVADFDGDSNFDVAIAAGSGVQLLRGNGDGTFQSPVTVVRGIGSWTVAAADYNCDGLVELAVGATTDIFLLRRAGNGSFPIAHDYPPPCFINSLFVADLNGDGVADLATPFGACSDNHSAAVFLGKGDSSFQAP